MDKDKKITTDEKKIETFAQTSSSDKQGITTRVSRLTMLFQSKFTMAFVILVLVATGILGYKAYQQTQNQISKKTVVKQVLVRRSKIPNIIVKATTAKAIDVKTGKVITAARVFSFNDKTVYLALDLNSAKSGTFIDYIRYLNGRYVDHGNVKITKNGTNNLTFNWTNTKPLGSVGDGKWKIATYSNGILEKRVNYTVAKSQVRNVEEELVLSSDSDYRLNHAISLSSKQ